MKITIHSCVFDRECRDHLNFPHGFTFEDGHRMRFPWDVSISLVARGYRRGVTVYFYPRPGVHVFKRKYEPWPEGATVAGMTKDAITYYDVDGNVLLIKARDTEGLTS